MNAWTDRDSQYCLVGRGQAIISPCRSVSVYALLSLSRVSARCVVLDHRVLACCLVACTGYVGYETHATGREGLNW